MKEPRNSGRTRQTPIQDPPQKPLTHLARLRKCALKTPRLDEARLGERDGVRVDVEGLGEEWFRGLDVFADEGVWGVGLRGEGQGLEDFGGVVSVEAGI